MKLVLYIALVSALIWLLLRLWNRQIVRIAGKRYWYRNIYVWSPSWRFARSVKLFLSFRKCNRCGDKKYLDVHHKMYSILGVSVLYWEWALPFVLEILCRDCHKKEHKEN